MLQSHENPSFCRIDATSVPTSKIAFRLGSSALSFALLVLPKADIFEVDNERFSILKIQHLSDLNPPPPSI